MAHGHRSTDRDSAEQLLALSGGLPVIQIGLDRENDLTSIRSAGIEGAAVPPLLLRLGRALTGEPA